MKKPFLIIIGIIVLVAVVFLVAYSTDSTESVDEPITSTNTDVLIYSGVVTSVDTSQVPVDGPVEITLETNSGAGRTILVPSFGFNLCPEKARENITDPYSLEAGDVIEARGQVNESGAIVLCGTSDDYLKLESSSGQATTTLKVGELDVVHGIAISLDKVVQESRCPTDAECIEAGAITVRVSLGYEGETQTQNIASDDVPYQFTPANRSVSITEINPPLYSGQEIAQEDYVITFSVE